MMTVSTSRGGQCEERGHELLHAAPCIGAHDLTGRAQPNQTQAARKTPPRSRTFVGRGVALDGAAGADVGKEVKGFPQRQVERGVALANRRAERTLASRTRWSACVVGAKGDVGRPG